MLAARSLLLALALTALAAAAAAAPRARRQLADDDALQPIDDAGGDEQTRDKRKFEGITQAKYGVKNAILGFVFGTGTTSRRRRTAAGSTDHHTGLNLQGTTSSGDPSSSRASSNRGPTSNSRGPSSRREDASSSRGRSFRAHPTSSSREPDSPREDASRGPISPPERASSSRELSFPRELTSDLSRRTSRARSTSSWSPPARGAEGAAVAGARSRRQSAAGDDIPEFDRNKVSLNIPGSLFGPSVSLLIRTTKIIGDVIQNSAVRYQTFLRLFRPLFRGQFEIKGLDPPTTTPRPTTTTRATTTTPTASPAEDNEVRRRRHL